MICSVISWTRAEGQLEHSSVNLMVMLVEIFHSDYNSISDFDVGKILQELS